MVERSMYSLGNQQ